MHVGGKGVENLLMSTMLKKTLLKKHKAKNIFFYASLLKNKLNIFQFGIVEMITTTIGGYFAIQISSQTTKKDVFEIPLLRTIIPRKLLSFCDTITFAPVQWQVLRNSQT